jgi:hypothetical protein
MVLWLLVAIAVVARTAPIVSMVMGIRAVTLLRRELGDSYKSSFTIACVPFKRWHEVVPPKHWQTLDTFRKRIHTATAVLLLGLAVWILLPTLIRLT